MTRRSTTGRSGAAAAAVVTGIGLLLAACGSAGNAAHRADAVLRGSNGSSPATVGAPAPALGAAAGGSAPDPVIAASNGTARGSSSGSGAGSGSPGSPTGGGGSVPATSQPPAVSTGTPSSSGAGGSSGPPASSGGPGGTGFGGGTYTALVSVSGPAAVAAAGSSEPYVATLDPQPRGGTVGPTPTGTVVFTLSQGGSPSATRVCTSSLKGTEASCTVTFPAAGRWFVDASFVPGSGAGGSSAYVSSQGSEAVTVTG